MTQAETDARRGSEAGEEPYVLDDQIGYLLRLANQRHTLIFQEQAVLELTPTQFSAMVRLLDEGECSQNELGRRTAMDVATVKGVVDRLRAKGLVLFDCLKSRDQAPVKPFYANVRWNCRRILTCHTPFVEIPVESTVASKRRKPATATELLSELDAPARNLEVN